MSLKNVHLLFVMVATLLALFCGAQAFERFRADGSVTLLGAALMAVVAAGLLVQYERRFLRRCREAGIR